MAGNAAIASIPQGIAGAPMFIPAHYYDGNPSDLQPGFPVASGPDVGSMLNQFNLSGSGLTDTSLDKFHDQNIQVGNLQSNGFATNKLGVCPEGWTDGDTWKETMIYVGSGTESQTTRKDLVYKVRSQQTLNAFNASEEGRRLTGNIDNAEELQKMARFVGPLEVGIANWQTARGQVNFITYIPSGRARVKEITRAQVAASTSERLQGAVPNEMDDVWILRTKCKRKDPLKCVLNNADDEIDRRLGKKRKLSDGSGASIEYESGNGVPNTYWNDFEITTTNRMKPRPWMYTSRGDGLDRRSRFTGMCTHVGKIQSTEGKRVANDSMTFHARRAQQGEGEWKMSLNKLRNMEIMVGMN